MADNERVVPQNPLPTDQIGQTPVTQADIDMMMSNIGQPTEQLGGPIAPAKPYPEPTSMESLGYAAGIIPGLGLLTGKAYQQKAKQASEMKMQDANALKFFETILGKDPRQAGELLKSSIFKDPLMRMAGASGEDIQNLSTTLSNKKLSAEEITKLYGAGGMLDKEGNVIPRPYAVEMEKQMERDDYDKFEKAAMASNKDMTEFDTMMLWNTKGRKGVQPLGWGAVTVGNKAVIYDKDTGKRIEVDSTKMQDYSSYPVLDENGFPQGIVIVSKQAPLGTNPKDVPYGYFDFRTEVMKYAPAETVRKIVGDREAVLTRMKKWLTENFGDNAELLDVSVPQSQVQSGNVEMPQGNEAEYAGVPPQGTAAEEEANKYY